MRTMMLAAIATLAALSQAAAQERPESLPQITIGGTRPKTSSCPNANNNANLDCLNQQLREQVDRVNPPSINAPLDARSPDTKIGIVNIPAVKQQYGQNFGVSVYPYRPPPPTYISPLGAHR
ncbi:MAG TPA: hypothetical protein VKV77_02340 [Methylovirgula sp.]|nr:hypothetical protein [Methylovirgula sp.]